MRKRRIVVAPEGIDDLHEIKRSIAAAAGTAVAERYLTRLQNYVQHFDIASERGTLREDIRPGLRIVGFERRITIAFAVFDEHVEVLRFFYGGQNWEDLV